MRRNSNNGSHRGNRGGRNRGGRSSGANLAQQKRTALQKKDNYLNQARDALSKGDRVQAEYYYQHAEHWLRRANELEEQMPTPQRRDKDEEAEGSEATESSEKEEGAEEGEASEEKRPRRERSNRRDRNQEGKGGRGRGRRSRDEASEEAASNAEADPNANHEEIPLPDSVIPAAAE